MSPVVVDEVLWLSQDADGVWHLMVPPVKRMDGRGVHPSVITARPTVILSPGDTIRVER